MIPRIWSIEAWPKGWSTAQKTSTKQPTRLFGIHKRLVIAAALYVVLAFVFVDMLTRPGQSAQDLNRNAAL